MRFILGFSLLLILGSCRNTEQARIDTVNECFGVKIPECADLERNDYEDYGPDYSFELEFHFEVSCYEEFLLELPNAEPYLVSSEENYDYYEWERDDHGERAKLEVFHAKREVIFHFVHL